MFSFSPVVNFSQLRNSNLRWEDCAQWPNATKTRSRYVSLAAVLSDQNTVAKDRPLPSIFLCLRSLCTIQYMTIECSRSVHSICIRFLGVSQLPMWWVWVTKKWDCMYVVWIKCHNCIHESHSLRFARSADRVCWQITSSRELLPHGNIVLFLCGFAASCFTNIMHVKRFVNAFYKDFSG